MFLIPSFLKKTKRFKIDPVNPQLKISVSPDTVLLDQEKNSDEKAIFILYQGSLQSYYIHDKNSFLGPEITQPGYFGFENFASDYFKEKNFPLIVTKTKCVISTFPVLNLLSLLKKNSQTYLAYFNQLNWTIDKICDYTNQVIQNLNNLRLFNIQIVHLMNANQLISSQESYQDYLEESFSDEDLFSFVYVSQNLNSYFKYSPASARKNDLAFFLLDQTTTQEMVSIFKKNLKMTNQFHENLFTDLQHIQNELMMQMGRLKKEFDSLFSSQNGFVKEVYQQKKNIRNLKSQQAFQKLYGFLMENIVLNEFLQNLFEVKEMAQFLEVEFEFSDVAENKKNKEKIQETREKNLGESDKIEDVEEMEVVDEDSQNITSNEIKLVKELVSIDELSRVQIIAIRKINTKFINLFLAATIKKFIFKESLASNEALLISTGALSQNFLPAKSLKFLRKKIKSLSGQSEHVFYLEQWLGEIAVGNFGPSNDALGTTYRKYLLGKTRNEVSSIEQEKSSEELAVDKLTYEMEEVIVSVLRSFNRNKKIVFGINETSFPAHPEASFVTPNLLENLLQEVIQYDPTLFFRESLYNFDDETKKIIEIEVLPIFIILPVVGSRIICWQEFYENNKKTPARFFVPMFFEEDLRKNFILAMAAFRWEICRAIKGSLWQSPVEGGITGAYSDYISFYKRNTSLSAGVKEKLAKFIRDQRKNHRRMFCQNYFEWLDNERVGLMRFNPYLRELFFKHIPFGKKTREHLKSLPNYENLVHVYELRSKKQKELLSKRYKKYTDEDGNLPEILNSHLQVFDR